MLRHAPDTIMAHSALPTQLSITDHETSVEDAGRLMEEINLLKLEGYLFCYDPRQAKKRCGTLTLEDARSQPVSIKIDPDFGQPSVLAYNVLQAILTKLTEEGIADWQNGRPVFGSSVSFSQRELAMLVERTWSGRTSQQLFEAIMQLRSTQIFASLYDKANDRWQVMNFQVLRSALFAGQGNTLSQCTVRLAPELVNSINQQHVSFFSRRRLGMLEPIGQVLYKRVFYNLSILNRPGSKRHELKFVKDYGTLCGEWLGRLKVLRYRSDIVRDQLGRHLDQLKVTGLIRRWAIDKNAASDGFNVAFWPGKGFFEDYRHFYIDKSQPQLRLQAAADCRTIQKPLELVAHFHQALGHAHHTCKSHETDFASTLLDRFDEHAVHDLIRYGIAAANRTDFPMRYFGALKRFVEPWAGDIQRTESRRQNRKRIEQCTYCNDQGFLELTDAATGSLSVCACSHDPAQIKRIFAAKGIRAAA